MSWIDALIHSFSTLSLGGFSSHDASLAFYDSVAIELVAVVFMVLAGINFSTHFQAWRARSMDRYCLDSELPYFLACSPRAWRASPRFLAIQDVYNDFPTALRHALFNTVSVATNTDTRRSTMRNGRCSRRCG
jgi:trk system potassium uptake protein TrkH